ncbi:MAG: tetratricopeptide repeat protein [Lentisphaerae bacterium]|nr:MAG: tetratricopeptide repeat protein [Lentisphaerota bacterium]
MRSKFVWCSLVVLFVGIIYSPEIFWLMARTGFNKANHEKKWAPALTLRSARFFVLFGRYQRALRIVRRIQQTWPPERIDAPRCQYIEAYCLERLGRYQEALEKYDQFLKAYPEHELAPIAKHRRITCQANL